MMRGRVKSFPADDVTTKPHFTAFLGYKAGMTHIVRDMDRADSRFLGKREVCEPVTILETPPIVVVGLVGYIKTPIGLRALKTVWANYLGTECRRRFYQHWAASKKKAFTRYETKNSGDVGKRPKDRDLANIIKHASVVRVIAHTQPSKVKLGPKKANIFEAQINGGSIKDKVDFATALFEKSVRVDSVFANGEIIDTIAVNKGHGFEGAITRWGVTRLPRKTHRGLRRVACIGAWHPARVRYTVARTGQHGCHHRTEINKKIYKLGLNDAEFDKTANFADFTQKPITPMGGFVWYGNVTEDYLMIKGSVPGPRKRLITLRKSLHAPRKRWMTENINLKFIDTASKLGHGRFQTSDEKKKFLGELKKDRVEDVIE
jgi:large subunit ribosomal protein L3e